MIHTLPRPYPVRVTTACESIQRDPNDRDIVTHITCDVGEEFTAIALVGADTTVVTHGDIQLEILTVNIVRIAALTCENRVAV